MLDVGCGAGALADVYRRINPDARYLGIEKEAEAARIAETSSASISGGRRRPRDDLALVTRTPRRRTGRRLPGLRRRARAHDRPLGRAVRLSQWVRVGGQVLASIPNVQHYAMLVDLLRGRWEYRSEWPPDRIDLRLFTLSGIQDLFARAGLIIFEIVPRWGSDSEFDKFQHLMAPVVRALGIDAATFAAQTRATEYLVRAVRETAEPRRMLIWSILGSAISSHVRIGEPGAFLATIPGIRVLSGTGVQFDELGKTWPGEAKVFLQQRVIIPRADHLRLQRASWSADISSSASSTTTPAISRTWRVPTSWPCAVATASRR